MLRGLRSIIPAAGEATRLRPHTLVKQKPMLSMGSDGKKIIDWSLNIASQTESTTVTLHFDESKTKAWISSRVLGSTQNAKNFSPHPTCSLSCSLS